MVYQSEYEKYRGLRALILTRVSTGLQAKKFSPAAQERNVRQVIIEPIMLHVIDVIRDTYTGLDYQYREVLDRILRMAERKEFDVLCMDVLDRGLGRKAVARELYRMQLRDFGIHILTTEPSDHSDDDSFAGLTARLHKGLKAEEEILDMVRRTTNGRREKALGNPEEGIQPQVVGCGLQRYGYKYVRNDKGTIIGYELNLDVIYEEPDGTKWTEVKVVQFIFELAADGVSLRKIAEILNEKGIPTSFVGRGIRRKGMTEDPRWQPVNISRLVKDTAYYGEYRYGKTVPVRVPGRKRPIYKETPGRALSPRRHRDKHRSGTQPLALSYTCPKPFVKNGRCPGCCIAVTQLDNAVAEYIKELIRDPSEVDTAIQELLKENPLKKQQQKKIKDLNKILQEQETLRANLSREMKKKNLSEQTVAILGRDLADLERQEKEAREDLANQQQVQQQYEVLDQRIAQFHQQCTEWREKLDDPQFTPDFHFYQEAVIFFGINVKVWKAGTEPPYQIRTRPSAIVELLS